jgi:predicted nucleic acid-binding protein
VVVVADTSVLIEYVNGREAGAVEEALTNDQLILPPLVISELVTGGIGLDEGMRIADVLRFARMHETTLRHWIAVGDLRRDLGRHGLKVTIPDAHVTQCVIDLDATLIARDKIFRLIAQHIPLRLA